MCVCAEFEGMALIPERRNETAYYQVEEIKRFDSTRQADYFTREGFFSRYRNPRENPAGEALR